MEMTYQGRVALVTGANKGIGLEVCRQLAEKGMTVFLGARDPDKGRTAVQELQKNEPGLDVRFVALDVDDLTSLQAAYREVDSAFGRLDVLINNAAILSGFEEKATTSDLIASHPMIETNLYGPWRTIQVFLPLLRKSEHPRLVNVSSGMGSHGDPEFGLPTGDGSGVTYAITKAALNALTVKLATELKAEPIRTAPVWKVNAVCPGFTATSAQAEAMGARPVAEGAASVVWAALLPDDGPTGGFFRDGKPLPW